MAPVVRKPKTKATAYPPALAALIPPKRRYVARWVSADKTDLDLIGWAHAHSKHVLLEGPTASGKTSGVAAYCHSKGMPLAIVQCDGAATPDTMLGRWVPTPDGGARWVWGNVSLAVMHGLGLLFDELNMLQPRMAASVHPLLDFRRSLVLYDHPFTHFCNDHGYLTADKTERHQHCDGFSEWDGPATIKAKDGMLVAATMNPGYAGTFDTNAALANRFLPIDYQYDEAVEEQLIASPKLRNLADRLRGNPSITTPVSTNRLMLFEEMVDDDEAGYLLAKETFFAHFAAEEQNVVNNVWSDAFEAELLSDYGLSFA